MTNNIAKFLKKLMDTNGLDYPWVSSSETYELALKSRLLAKQEARLLFYILLGGLEFKKKIEAVMDCQEENPTAALSALINEACHLDEPTCNACAETFIQLYSSSNREEWVAAEKSGLKEFCRKKWTFKWTGRASWSADHVYVDCEAEASFMLTATDSGKIEALLGPLLDKNPFMKASSIFEFISASLCKQLDDDFEGYCCSDYYPPVVEDYGGDCEDVVISFCEENGLAASGFSFEGCTGNYEPNF